MMPKKDPKIKRSIMLGVQVNEITKQKLKYLADMEGETVSTYVYKQIIKHLDEKEPWLTKEIEESKMNQKESAGK